MVIEECIVGQEVECSVMGKRCPQSSIVGKSLPSADFHDYDDKYKKRNITALSQHTRRRFRRAPSHCGTCIPSLGLHRFGACRFLCAGWDRSSAQRAQCIARIHLDQHVSQTLGSMWRADSRPVGPIDSSSPLKRRPDVRTGRDREQKYG